MWAETYPMKISTTFRKIVRHPGIKLWAVLLWLGVWLLAYKLINEDRRDLLLSSPIQVGQNLWHLVKTPEYWERVLFSSRKVMTGMLAGAVLGTVLGTCAFFVPFIKELFRPLISVIRSIPVVSFIVLAVYWIGYVDLGRFIAFLICLPVFYSNTLSGLGAADKNLLEMAKVFRFGFFRKFTAVYLPALVTHLFAAGEVAVGLAWKSGTAAEFIAYVSTVRSVGAALYNAKKDLLTAELLSWTVTIVVLSALFSLVFRLLLRLATRRWGVGK